MRGQGIVKLSIQAAIFTLFGAALAGNLTASPWEGASAIAPFGVLPEKGYYVAANSFPIDTVVNIDNLETGQTIQAIVRSTEGTPGGLVLLSREAAAAIGMRADTLGRIRITAPAESIAYSRYLDGRSYAGGDPDFNPRAAIDTYGIPADFDTSTGVTPPPYSVIPSVESSVSYPDVSPSYLPRYERDLSFSSLPSPQPEIFEPDTDSSSSSDSSNPFFALAEDSHIYYTFDEKPFEEYLAEPDYRIDAESSSMPNDPAEFASVTFDEPFLDTAEVSSPVFAPEDVDSFPLEEGFGSWLPVAGVFGSDVAEASSPPASPQNADFLPLEEGFDLSRLPAAAGEAVVEVDEPGIAIERTEVIIEDVIPGSAKVLSMVPAEHRPPPSTPPVMPVFPVEPLSPITTVVIPEPVQPAELPESAYALSLPVPQVHIEDDLPTPSRVEPIPAPPVVMEGAPLPEIELKAEVIPEPERRYLSDALPHIQQLEKGKYYLQLGIYNYNQKDELDRRLSTLKKHYPLVIQNAGGAEMKLMVGPMNEGESNAVLLHVKHDGFKSAFIRHDG